MNAVLIIIALPPRHPQQRLLCNPATYRLPSKPRAKPRALCWTGVGYAPAAARDPEAARRLGRRGNTDADQRFTGSPISLRCFGSLSNPINRARPAPFLCRAKRAEPHRFRVDAVGLSLQPGFDDCVSLGLLFGPASEGFGALLGVS